MSESADRQPDPPLTNKWDIPDVGIGIGLRTVHYPHILEHWPEADWFEIVSENFMTTQGRPLYILDQIAERYPIVMHGVAMSIGSTDPLDMVYLKRLKDLAKRVNAKWLGDHVCWTGVAGKNTHDLMPIPYNDRTLKHVVERIKIVQDYLERPIVMENPSTYMTFKDSTIAEEEFIARMAEESDCGLLLDVNNVYVTCRNHGLNALEYLEGVPYERVVQFHLAGHQDKGTHCLDTHDGPVIDPVWELYAKVHEKTGGRSTLLEWDDQIPEFEEVHTEAMRASAYRKQIEVNR